MDYLGIADDLRTALASYTKRDQEGGELGQESATIEFSDMLSDVLLRYQNRTLDTATVIAELVDLAKKLQAEQHRGEDLGLSEDELAFYDAIRTNDSAVLQLGDDQLKKIAHELLEIVRRDAKTDWAVKEQVRARLRTTIKRLLRKYHYPPDQQESATQLVLEQAEVIAADQEDGFGSGGADDGDAA